MNESNIINYVSPLLILSAAVFSIVVTLSSKLLEQVGAKEGFPGSLARGGRVLFVEIAQIITGSCLLISNAIAGIIFILTAFSIFDETAIARSAYFLTVSYVLILIALMGIGCVYCIFKKRMSDNQKLAELRKVKSITNLYQ